MNGSDRESDPQKHWFVAQVKPRQEKLAICHLERQGFLTHCPLVVRSRIVLKKPAMVRELLFPGYVFVALGDKDRWRSINGTIGVSRLVTFGNEPARVPRGFVERLLCMAEEDGHPMFEKDLQPGDDVRVVGGPFDDLCGSLASIAGSERVVVLLKMLSGETRVTLTRGQLVAA